MSKTTSHKHPQGEVDIKELSAQLRKPEGEFGLAVADNLNQSNERITQYTYNNMEVEDGQHVLEIGFGNGKLMDHLLTKAEIKLCGIDFSDTMVQEARTHHADNIKKEVVDIKHGSIEAIPYDDNYFDKICHINTLYFWPDPLACAKETLRVLKKGGSIYSGIRLKEQIQHFPFTQHGFTLYSEEQAVQLFVDAGFSKVVVEKQQDPPYEWEGKTIEIESVCIIATK